MDIKGRVEQDLTTCCLLVQSYGLAYGSCENWYSGELFVHQCLSAGDGDIPIRLVCSGSCQAIISFTKFDAASTRDQLCEILGNSFTHHVRTHPRKHQYCPTPDCDQVCEVSNVVQHVHCICTKCETASQRRAHIWTEQMRHTRRRRFFGVEEE